MDRQIDLTLRRDFRNEARENNFMDRLAFHITKSRCPWATPKDLEPYKEVDFRKYNIIIPGNKKQRKSFKEGRFYSGHICERCGEDLGKVPWRDFKTGLCNKCIKEMNWDKKQKVCWRENTIGGITLL